MDEKIKKAQQIVKDSSSITVLTGAGISSESGIPTFREKEGLWKNYNPEELASPHAFKANPKLVWEWYDWRRQIIAKAEPNPAHKALVKLEKNKKEGFTLITQNVDGLHKKAGNKNIVELHGNIWEIRCPSCNLFETNFEVPLTRIPPLCNRCGSLMRPNVVWFGEIIPMPLIDKSIYAIENSQVMLIVGTSGIVEPAASMGLMAKKTGKTVIEVNLNPTPNSSIYDFYIQGKAGEILPLICQTEI